MRLTGTYLSGSSALRMPNRAGSLTFILATAAPGNSLNTVALEPSTEGRTPRTTPTKGKSSFPASNGASVLSNSSWA
jgi:hypothetical protein